MRPSLFYGALFGIGTVTRQAKWKTISTIVTALVTTLPLAAGLGWAAYTVLTQVF